MGWFAVPSTLVTEPLVIAVLSEPAEVFPTTASFRRAVVSLSTGAMSCGGLTTDAARTLAEQYVADHNPLVATIQIDGIELEVPEHEVAETEVRSRREVSHEGRSCVGGETRAGQLDHVDRTARQSRGDSGPAVLGNAKLGAVFLADNAAGAVESFSWNLPKELIPRSSHSSKGWRECFTMTAFTSAPRGPRYSFAELSCGLQRNIRATLGQSFLGNGEV